MPELPKIVTSKLAERELRPDASHPDPNLLTAFVERSLPERERGAVLGHLAACSPCREIVALAQPAEASASTVVVVPPKSLWSRGLFLRWGTLAACAALAVSLVTLHKKENHAAMVAEQRVPGPPLSATEADTKVDKNVPVAPSEPILAGKPASRRDSQTTGVVSKTAAPIAVAPWNDASAAVGTYLRGRRLSGIPTPGPSAPMNNNAGFGGNNAFSGVASAARNYDLTANGRNLSQLTPGIAAEAGAAAGTGAGARMASKPAQWAVADAKKQSEANFGLDEVAQDGFAKKDELAKKREGSRAKEKAMTLEVGSASETAQVSAPAPSVLSPATAGAMTAAPARREGEIRGVVRDASGAAISGAKVTVTNTATGSSVVSSTDSAGIYAVAAAPVGPYTVAVTKAGFQTFVRQGVNLEPPTVAVNATLQVGATSSAVTVEAQDVAVDTTSATASTTTAYAPTNKDDFRASSAEISNLPGLATARQAGTWQVTDSGNLQRSLDGGKSWKNVSLSASTRLRVVTATGFQVWAGGNGGVLFHSRDAGGHFAAVKVHKKHVTLAGDIVTLAFADARHGRLETADHEVWTTTDGGKTWLPAAPVK